jgi:hypothetical protein
MSQMSHDRVGELRAQVIGRVDFRPSVESRLGGGNFSHPAHIRSDNLLLAIGPASRQVDYFAATIRPTSGSPVRKYQFWRAVIHCNRPAEAQGRHSPACTQGRRYDAEGG